MKRILVTAMLCVTVSAPAFAQQVKGVTGRHDAGAEAALRRQIMALEARRVAAMVNKDIATLDAILADDLTYTHSAGRTDNKSSFLALIKGPDNRYLGIDYSNTEVIVSGDAVIVRGIAQIRLGDGPRGPATSYPVLFLDVYARRNGAWRMVAWQATRVGE